MCRFYTYLMPSAFGLQRNQWGGCLKLERPRSARPFIYQGSVIEPIELATCNNGTILTQQLRNLCHWYTSI